MKSFSTFSLVIAGLFLSLSACATRQSHSDGRVPVYQAPLANSPGRSQIPLVSVTSPASAVWPLMIPIGSTNVTIYEPHFDSWDGERFEARTAVALQPVGAEKPQYGVAQIQGLTLVDKNTRNVSLEGIQVKSTDLPGISGETNQYITLLKSAFPSRVPGLSLDWMEGSFAPRGTGGSVAPRSLNNTPPNIIVSTQAAVLVSIDGPPVYRPITNTGLQRVLNTRVLLLKDSNAEHYLHILDGYMKAPALAGPWTVSTEPPAGAALAEQIGNAAAPIDLLQADSSSEISDAPALTQETAPAIYVATGPAELIVFEGSPAFTPIPNTHLLYATNTSGNVFRSTDDARVHVLLSGRWFTAASLQGPWQFVPANQLPADFARIPDDSPKENVKASVPGTRQASEALIANAIPQSSKIARTLQMQNPQIDGQVQLKRIEGTPLSYLVNSATPIIKVDDNAWYACQNGVWFTSASLSEPWVVAASVPPVIYTIPVTSPLHYLTYVRVFGADSESVYEGYTPGYLGTEVSPEGVVVYGSGYPYDPWVGEYWYSGPATWGYGWGPCWNPWDDWCFGLGFGWSHRHHRGWHGRPPGPCWGPYRQWPHREWGLAQNERRGAWVNTAQRVYEKPSRLTGQTVPRQPEAYNSRTGAHLVGPRNNSLVPARYYRPSQERTRFLSGPSFPSSERVGQRRERPAFTDSNRPAEALSPARMNPPTKQDSLRSGRRLSPSRSMGPERSSRSSSITTAPSAASHMHRRDSSERGQALAPARSPSTGPGTGAMLRGGSGSASHSERGGSFSHSAGASSSRPSSAPPSSRGSSEKSSGSSNPSNGHRK